MYLFVLIVCLSAIGFICFENHTTTKLQTENKIQQQIKSNDSTVKQFTDLNKDAFRLHYDAIVIDSHNDIMMPVLLEGADMTKNNTNTQSDLVKWQKGGLDVQIFSVYVPERYKTNHFNYVMKLIDNLESTANENPDKLILCYNYEQLSTSMNKGKLCGLLGAEGGAMIEGSIEKLDKLYERGVRYLGLTWNTSNEIGISARDETSRKHKGGLTEFGKNVVKRMDELGMLVDVSHLGETAFWEVVSLSKNPIIASHSNVYSICPHYRNLTDDQIKAIAKSGGYIGINFYCKFLEPNAGTNNVKTIHTKYKSAIKTFEIEYENDLIAFNEKRYEYLKDNYTSSGTPVDILIDHIDYIVKLVGVDYVGLGSDFDGGVYTPNELYDATCYPIITKKLVERGYNEDDIRKILGGNFLRVFKQVSK